MPQDRLACLGSTPLKAPRVPPTHSAQFEGQRRQATNNGASEHHLRDCGNRRETTIGFSGASRGGFNEPTTLSDVVRGSKYGYQEDFRVIRGLDSQRLPTLGVLQCTDVWTLHRPRQVPWGKVSRHGGDLASDVIGVRDGVDGGGYQGGLRDRVALLWN